MVGCFYGFALFHAHCRYVTSLNIKTLLYGVLIITSEERREVRYQRRAQKRKEKRRRHIEGYDNYENVISFNAILNGYKKSRRGVGWKGSVQRYGVNLFRNALNTCTRLEQCKPVTKGFSEFILMERGKARHIKSVHISERCIQRSLCDNALVPVLSRSLIYDNGASIKGKGIHFSLNRVNAHLRRYYRKHGNDGYVLVMDFKSYFENIRHEPIYDELDARFEDKRIVNLAKQFVGAFGDKSLGLGSQVSQILAVHYTNKIDHFIKEQLGIKYYGRYMDDCYLIHHDKGYLRECLSAIREKCKERGLVLNGKKTQLIKLSRGFTFLKTRLYLTDTGKVVNRPSKDSIVRMRRKLKKFKKMLDAGEMEFRDIYTSYMSWRGYIKHKDAYRTIKAMDGLFSDLFIRQRAID